MRYNTWKAVGTVPGTLLTLTVYLLKQYCLWGCRTRGYTVYWLRVQVWESFHFWLGVPAWPSTPFCHLKNGHTTWSSLTGSGGGFSARLWVLHTVSARWLVVRFQFCQYPPSKPDAYSAIDRAEGNVPLAGRIRSAVFPPSGVGNQKLCVTERARIFWL